MEVLNVLGEFDPAYKESVYRAYNSIRAKIPLSERHKPYKSSERNFADFVGEIAEMLRDHTLNELTSEVLNPSSVDYCQNMLKDAWKTEGYEKYIRLIQLTTPEAERAIKYYAELFSSYTP